MIENGPVRGELERTRATVRAAELLDFVLDGRCGRTTVQGVAVRSIEDNRDRKQNV